MKRNNNSTTVGRFALSCVAAAALSVTMGNAFALGLGRLSVQSALGEGLRAEIDVTSLTPEEAAGLRAKVASPDAYQAAGIDYNSVLTVTQISLQKRADGQPFLRVSSDRPVQEPFVDLILELNWANGRLVREYTLLLDPPTQRASTALPPVMPPVSASPRPAAAPVAPPAESLPPKGETSEPASSPSAPGKKTPATAVAEKPAATEAAPKESASEPAAETRPTEVKVGRGESLTRIAARVQPQGVSLDQMVVSLYRANPQAFIGDNMNRLKSGAVLSVPDPEQVQAVSPQEARKLIHVQSADFAAYRQRLAAAAGTAGEESGRQVSGTVEAAVQDRRLESASTPDRLTLSKGAVSAVRGGASAPEDALVAQRQQNEARERLAEVSRNMEDLRRLSVPAGSASAATPAPAAAASAAASSVGLTAALPASAASEPLAAASEAASEMLAAASDAASEPLAPASEAASQEAAASEPAAEASPVEAVPVEEPGMLDGLLENPLLLPAVGGLALVLGGLGGYQFWKRRKLKRMEAGETSFLESRLQPDSFFGVSGGSHVDTAEDAAGAALGYSLSQMDAPGDVDPVAEADVYLAYGRDLQAEEILKEAMRTDPDRLAIRTKMLEVYAKRRDTRGFEVMASQLRVLTSGQGPDWDRACELGASIDPDNALYKSSRAASTAHPDGPGSPQAAAFVAESASGVMAGAAQATRGAAAANEGAQGQVDFDLSRPHDLPPAPDRSIDLEVTRPLPAAAEALAGAPAPAQDNGLAFDLGELDLSKVAVPGAAKPAAAPAPEAAMDFQLSGLSLDLDAPAVAAQPAAAQEMFLETTPGLSSDDPLAQKLELANEFLQIGDPEGARELLMDVVSQADGPLKAKAQGLLDAMAA